MRPTRGSALAVLRSLTGLLETSLLALLDARVARQESGLLERRAVGFLVDLVERTGDAEAQRAGLTRHAATGDASDDVEAVLQSRLGEGLLGDLLVQLVGEVLLERLAVDGPHAGARNDADARDGFLATPRRGTRSDRRGLVGGDSGANRLGGVCNTLGVGLELGLFG